nr:dihydrolipoyllysine-residue acetyltransferase [Burkholderiales bacterium]
MSTIEVKVPDIGDFTDVPVIEVLVKAGDKVKVDDSLVTLESDKATMDVPSTVAGTVKSVAVKVGDKVSEGAVVVLVEAAGAGAAAAAPSPQPAPVGARGSPAAAKPVGTASAGQPSPQGVAPGGAVEVKVPDIGDFADVPVIEVFVKPGDVVKVDDALVTLESDKATMDVPSTVAGTVRSVLVKVGDKVAEGSLVVVIDAAGAAPSPQPSPASGRGSEAPAAASVGPASAGRASAPSPAPQPRPAEAGPAPTAAPIDEPAFRVAHASPSVRMKARDLGVDLSKVAGTGPKNRILAEDVRAYVKKVLAGVALPGAPAGGGAISGGGELNLIPWPKVDFAKFGPVEAKPLSRIKKLSGANLARNWVMIPHVTQFDEADITDLEALRVALNKENEKAGVKLTMLAFLIKASVAALKKFPDFNASLDGDNLVMKHYFHIGFAADTPNGLVVPVLKNADQKGVLQIAKEMGELSAKAREGKLGPADMQGGCFSISSLGG